MASFKLFIFILAVASIVHGDRGSVISRAAVSKLWPQGTVCYRYDSSVTERLQNMIRRAMDIWEHATCLKFENSTANDCVLFYDYPNQEYCTSSSNGRGNGRQKVTLGYACQTVGDVLYTLGLVIGLHPEQNRPDRNMYVRILNDNIEDDQEKNFASYDFLSAGYQGVSYDYASIMHLSASAFSKGGRVTIEVVNREAYAAQGSPKLGNRLGLSQGDILKANRLYNCPRAGICEVLSVNIGSVRNFVTSHPANYRVEVVGVDNRGRKQNLSSSIIETPNSPGNINLTWNERLEFPVNMSKWQFFRIALKESCTPSEDRLLSMVETVAIEETRSASLHRSMATELGTAELSFSYECVADSNDCDPNPCVSATRCNDELFHYTCDCREGFGGRNCNIQCPRGYSGYNCTIDVSGDSCSSSPCVNGNSANCADGFFDYTCSCLTGYGGKNCEITCPRGYSGRYCGRDISGNSCQPNPCRPYHSISCVDQIYDYNCTCVTGFGGKKCERSCPHGYGGFNCDIDVSGDSCLSNPCNAMNSLSCVDGFFDYTCNCEEGYGGKDCSRVCPRGFDGYDCTIDISNDSCAPNPCHSRNTLRCTDGLFDYTCTCKGGYGGKTCRTDLCAGGACSANGGSCIPDRASPWNYRCECPLAWNPSLHCRSWETRCLKVLIRYARGLSDRDGFLKGDSDPYTTITAYSSRGRSVSGQTRYIQGDESPDWNHWFNAGCDYWERFYFRIYDSDWGSDDALSSGQTIYLRNLNSLPSCRLTIPVVGGRGSITFDVYYYTNGAPSGQPGSC